MQNRMRAVRQFRCADVTRCDGISGDADVRKLACDAADHRVHAALGRVVHRVIHQPGAHRVRADVDYATVASRDHVRQHRSYAINGRPQVVVDGGPQRLLGVLEGGQDYPAAGVADQNVDIAERLDRCAHQVVCRAGSVEVAGESARDTRMLVYALQIVLAASRSENRCAIGNQTRRDTQADTGSGSGDNCCPASQWAAHRMIATSPTDRRSVMSNSALLEAIRKPPTLRRNR